MGTSSAVLNRYSRDPRSIRESRDRSTAKGKVTKFDFGRNTEQLYSIYGEPSTVPRSRYKEVNTGWRSALKGGRARAALAMLSSSASEVVKGGKPGEERDEGYETGSEDDDTDRTANKDSLSGLFKSMDSAEKEDEGYGTGPGDDDDTDQTGNEDRSSDFSKLKSLGAYGKVHTRFTGASSDELGQSVTSARGTGVA